MTCAFAQSAKLFFYGTFEPPHPVFVIDPYCNDDLSAFGSSMAVRHLHHRFGGVDLAVVNDVKSQLPNFFCLKSFTQHNKFASLLAKSVC